MHFDTHKCVVTALAVASNRGTDQKCIRLERKYQQYTIFQIPTLILSRLQQWVLLELMDGQVAFLSPLCSFLSLVQEVVRCE